MGWGGGEGVGPQVNKFEKSPVMTTRFQWISYPPVKTLLSDNIEEIVLHLL